MEAGFLFAEFNLNKAKNQRQEKFRDFAGSQACLVLYTE